MKTSRQLFTELKAARIANLQLIKAAEKDASLVPQVVAAGEAIARLEAEHRAASGAEFAAANSGDEE